MSASWALFCLRVGWRLVKEDRENPEKATVVVGDSLVYSHVRLSQNARHSIMKELSRCPTA